MAPDAVGEWLKLALAVGGVAGVFAAVGSALINQGFALNIANRNRAHSEKREAYLAVLDAYGQLVGIESKHKYSSGEEPGLAEGAAAMHAMARARAQISLVGLHGPSNW